MIVLHVPWGTTILLMSPFHVIYVHLDRIVHHHPSNHVIRFYQVHHLHLEALIRVIALVTIRLLMMVDRALVMLDMVTMVDWMHALNVDWGSTRMM